MAKCEILNRLHVERVLAKESWMDADLAYREAIMRGAHAHCERMDGTVGEHIEHSVIIITEDRRKKRVA